MTDRHHPLANVRRIARRIRPARQTLRAAPDQRQKALPWGVASADNAETIRKDATLDGRGWANAVTGIDGDWSDRRP